MRVLLDCDGLCSDWVKAVLELVEEASGMKISPADIDSWLILSKLGMTASEQERVESEIASPGFCASLEVLPGALEGVRRLKEVADVHFVTTPWLDSPTWSYERANWLIENGFAESHDDVTHTSSKHMVNGSVLVDDKPRNVEQWQKENPCGQGLIWSAPWNRRASGYRVGGWDDLLSYVKWWQR